MREKERGRERERERESKLRAITAVDTMIHVLYYM